MTKVHVNAEDILAPKHDGETKNIKIQLSGSHQLNIEHDDLETSHSKIILHEQNCNDINHKSTNCKTIPRNDSSKLHGIMNCDGDNYDSSVTTSDVPMKRSKTLKSPNSASSNLTRRRRSVHESLTQIQRSNTFTNRRASFADQHGNDLHS